MLLRPLQSNDIPALVAIWNLLNPDWPRSSTDQIDAFQKREAQHHYKSWVAEVDGNIVGEGLSEHSISSFHPQKFLLEVYVHPNFHGQGIGKRLYGQVLEDLKPLNPIALRVQVRETSYRALRFFADRGFKETKRDWVSTLDVSKVNLELYQDLESKLKTQNITIATLAHISDAEKYKKFHTLFSEVRLDTPRSDPATPISFKFFMDNVINVPEFNPELFFVALHEGRYIGLTGLYPITGTTILDQWLTAVKREFRGQQLALALKVCSIQHARTHGYTHIRTDNDSRNAPMLAINTKLGFERGAASISLAA